MKKSFFKVLIASFGFLFAFTSCLDDGGESSSKVENAFAYVTQTESGTKMLWASIYSTYSVVPLSNADFQASDLQVGDCVFINYKFSYDNWVNTSYINADYIDIDENKIYRKKDQVTAKTASFNDVELEEDKEYFRELSTTSASNTLIVWNSSMLGYRWFISYKYNKRDSDQPARLLVSLDEDTNKEFLSTGEVILDFQLEKQGTPGEGDASVVAQSDIINFTNLQLNLQQYADAKKELKVRFRYYREVTNPKEGEPKYELVTTPNSVITLSFSDDSAEK